jgi:colanic acid/amylovoran biosynthesis glycosyltransferase
MSRRLRVVHFIECWLPQTEIWLLKHLQALPQDVESIVVCQWTQNLDQFPVGELSSLDQPPVTPNLGKRILRRLGMWDERKRHLHLLEQVIQDRKPDILHSHFGHYGWINSEIARQHGLSHVVSYYGFDVGYLPRGDRRWYSRYSQMSDLVDRVLCEGPHMAQCIAGLGVDTKKIRVLRLGVDLQRIPFVPRVNTINYGKLRFLIAGSFREKKGIPYALEALGLFHKSFPDIEITVVGDAGGSDREQREKRMILDQVQLSALSDKTRFLGYQSHERLLQEFYTHQIFLSPSVTAFDGDTEGGAPVTIIEAAASGMPVVSTTHCDIPFVLAEANRPYLAPERDVSALSRAIGALVALRDWEPIVTANRLLIEKELDVRTQGRRLGEIYRRAHESRSGSREGT